MEKKRSIGVTVIGLLVVLGPIFYYLELMINFLVKSTSLKLFPSRIIQMSDV